MEAARVHRLFPPDAEVRDGDPASYAEALIELHNLRAKTERLEDENGHLGEALKREVVAHRRTKGQLHKDLRLHKDYAAVERLWGKYREAHPRSGEHVPEDWLKLALSRLKDFDEAVLSRALDGAHANPPVSDDGRHVYDKWDNVFRSTGHVLRYVERADKAEGRAQAESRQGARPEVQALLAELGVSRLRDLLARCECGVLMIHHPSRDCSPCDDPDDSLWRAMEWDREKREELGRRPARCPWCPDPVTADQWRSALASWLGDGPVQGFYHVRCADRAAEGGRGR